MIPLGCFIVPASVKFEILIAPGVGVIGLAGMLPFYM
tara:strand:+ start:970 stop:1080 length:111 start_codon:yes stop_codon:yes gene_type:complete